MNQDPDIVHQSVREHYAAQATAGSCCGPSSECCGSSSDCCSSSSALYPVEMLSELPEDVASFSLGCGDPISIAELQPGQTVLDLGSGGGLDCLLASKRVGEAGHVIGVDMTPEMIERATKAADRLGAKNVEFRQGLLEQLPVEDSTVDVVISNCVINLAPDKNRGFAEIWRVLKPGGKLAVSDIVTEGPLPDEIKGSLSAWAGCIAGALDVGEYKQMLAAAGLVNIEVAASYFDEAIVDEAVRDIGEAAIQGLSREAVSKAVFSARITARKP